MDPITRPPVLGLMLGDCTGIGPEQCARILSDGRLDDAARLLVVGDTRILQQGARDAGVELCTRSYTAPEAVEWSRPGIPVIDLANLDPARIARGRVSPESGRISGETLAYMIELTRGGRIDGIVFAPLNKTALQAGGWRFNDEHQMFAHLTGHAGFFGEMNVLDSLWMSRVTSHVALRTALEQITAERIDQALTLADETMRSAGFEKPRIAVAALNPHAGENGLFGREELDLIAPAVSRAAERGIACRGPFPADTVFLKAFAGDYDGVLTMYHDQGQIATKLKGFNRGVTVTGGLSTVFTTPAHGTAFDIVGKGCANTGALEHAVRLAARLAVARQRAQAAPAAV
ncbi:MAG TPA: 4-hydroxythreonine-4-phosphate dehydrogenase PdxA [Casimicrobiaceae bacterium]|nr:4-hydroxythreonine-4-phosphate dehydrogenase PdxA [Casimicrobiaceae bacterium]